MPGEVLAERDEVRRHKPRDGRNLARMTPWAGKWSEEGGRFPSKGAMALAAWRQGGREP